MAGSTFVYTSYIRTTPERLWQALTDPGLMRQYWFGFHAESGWTAGSPWRIVDAGGKTWDDGAIVEADAPRKLVIRWRHRNDPAVEAEGDSLCTMELAPQSGAVGLTITHAMERDASRLIANVAGGWPMVVSNLKSLLETGSPALQDL